ncbi:interleukin-1 beta isoform X1 [Takifugu rubripes]|uniref:Interleukin-1 n=1 Tax=Takifugu rubripes TaxID=31033 RepID=H2UVE3_TAKRU|nr:interleukin-1 beta [Takifugu rubripes]XP_011614128.1 interleukin-1 beta isoform X1 [Takifugu rubripes]WAB71021.1 interleukin 1beta [Takifugu obscurus]BAM44876.1 interleukin-1beta [Takifugu rubripes]|eukprot:NP_001267019.1 interleukin-1 beta [Takifugu rubripes]
MESQMKSNESKMLQSQMPEGLELEITHHPLTMKSVVNLVIAMERLKGNRSESLLSTEFRDENLLSMMMDTIVEEQIVFERYSAPPVQKYMRMSMQEYSVSDSEKRSLIRVPDSMELNAVMLQGGSECRKVNLNLSTYVHLESSINAQTVALGIRGTNFFLSCHKDGEEPTLHLEAVEDKEQLSSISSDSELVRFLFNKHITGINLCTLVSVPYSDWYISTAVEENKPVEMCLESAQRNTIFTLLALKKTPTCEGEM